MANFIPTGERFDERTLLERIETFPQQTEDMVEWIIEYDLDMVFMLPVDPDYDPDLPRRVVQKLLDLLRVLFRNLKPRTTRAIEWELLRSDMTPLINGFSSMVRVTAKARGISMATQQQMIQNILMLGTHHRRLIQLGLDALSVLETEFATSFVEGLIQTLILEDRSRISRLERIVPEQIQLTPEEELQILRRRKQQLQITSQEREFILQQRQAQQEPAPQPEPEPEPEPESQEQPRRRPGFFSRMVSFFRRIFRGRE